MTDRAARLVDVARSQLGTSEAPPGSNRTPYGDWYGMTAAWCGMFVSWCADQAQVTDLVPRFAYTPTGAEWFQQRGQWSRQPRVGSLAFYDVSGMGRISHVGIVEATFADGSWNAIEGNTDSAGSRTGGSVRRQRRTTVGTLRGGFGHPAYRPEPSGQRPGAGWPTVRFGSSGIAVRAAQGALNVALSAAGKPTLTVDGAFGPATRTAVVWFQNQRGLTPDGIVGPLTWRALGAS